MKKLIAFAGSNSSTSINKKLATYAASLFEGFEKEILDLNDYPLPLFSVDTEKEIGSPPAVSAFMEKIRSADLIVLSLAENNAIYSVAFKNIFDWVSRKQGKEVFMKKPMLLMAASTGKRGGANVLEFATSHLPRYGADIRATYSFPMFEENFKEGEGITNKELKDALVVTVNKVLESGI
jgi:chromate reductase, NAD(P)H dehydrogenase (quinone)